VRWPPWAAAAAPLLAALALARRGISADGFAWAAVEVVLVGVAAEDIAARRIANRVTVPVSLLSVLLRLAVERSHAVEVVAAGAAAFAAFLLVGVASRGGIGMGDAKLAGMLGFLLGRAVLAALAVGVLAGAVAAAVVLARTGSRRATIAYGPYLVLGGIVAVAAAQPPPLL